MSGLTTALDLAERGVRDIVVADHGPFVGFEHQTRTSDPVSLPPPPAAWSSTSEHYSTLPGVVSPVGGRSRCWHGVVLPISRELLRRHWPRRIADRLLGEGPGSYTAVTRDLEQWHGGPLDAPHSGSDRTLLTAFGTIWPDVPFSVVPQACRCVDGSHGRHLTPYSPLLAWNNTGLARHRAAALPVVAPGHQALRLLVDGSKVTGALFRTPDGTTREILADVVVVAAGTLETTRLYAQALAVAGNVVTRWPGLNDHLTHGVVVPLPPALTQMWSRPDRGFLFSKTESEFNANLFTDVHAAGLPEPILDLWWMAEQEAPQENAICFDPQDDGVWTARVEAFLSSADHKMTRQRNEIAEQLLSALSVPGFTEAGFSDIGPAIEHALAGREAVHYGNPLGIADHDAGTVPFGKHLEFGGKADWADNLFLTGPATFPVAGASNPTLTMLALAAQTAETIAEGRS